MATVCHESLRTPGFLSQHSLIFQGSCLCRQGHITHYFIYIPARRKGKIEVEGHTGPFQIPGMMLNVSFLLSSHLSELGHMNIPRCREGFDTSCSFLEASQTAKYEGCFCYTKREGLWAYNYQILSQEKRVDFFLQSQEPSVEYLKFLLISLVVQSV